MKRSVRYELLTRWCSAMGTPMLKRVITMIEIRSWMLVRGVFQTPGGNRGCLAHWFGLADPICRDAEQPGIAWLASIGLPERSRVVSEWDHNPLFAKQLLRALKRE